MKKNYNVVEDLNLIATARAQNTLSKETDILNEINSVLDNAEAEDMKMLDFFGTSEIYKESLKKKAIAEKTISTKGNFVFGADVQTICEKYLLRVLPVKLYKKPIPKFVLNDLKNYEKKRGKKLDQENLFIIAPKSHFDLKSKPKNDPVILYRTKEPNHWRSSEVNVIDEFEVVSTFGKDFTYWRLVKAFFHYKGLTMFFIASALLEIYLFITKIIPIIKISAIKHNESIPVNILFGSFAACAVFFVFALFIFMIIDIDNEPQWNKEWK